jgi:hypothetical protein
MKTTRMKTGGFAIYDAPAGLRKFLEARESGTASKELLMQLSADAMAVAGSRSLEKAASDA